MSEDSGDDFSDAKLKAFCDEIVLCLVIYGDMDEVAARHKVAESGICDPERHHAMRDKSIFFHDIPYYYAMNLLHGQEKPFWWNDASLWPPPAELSDPCWPDTALKRRSK